MRRAVMLSAIAALLCAHTVGADSSYCVSGGGDAIDQIAYYLQGERVAFQGLATAVAPGVMATLRVERRFHGADNLWDVDVADGMPVHFVLDKEYVILADKVETGRLIRPSVCGPSAEATDAVLAQVRSAVDRSRANVQRR